MDPNQVERGEDGIMRCRECGFRYALSREDVIRESLAGLEAVRGGLDGVPEYARSSRPAPAVWSVNAYASHLADASAVILSRIRSIATDDRPPLAWHDQDRAVEEQHADEIPAASSLERLSENVNSFVSSVNALPDTAWERVGVHSKAGEVRLGEIAQDMPHELHHHAMDIRRAGASNPT